MPYTLKGNCVIKKDTGAVVKCHPDHKKALAHLAALEINVSEAHKDFTEKYSPSQLRDRLGRWTSGGISAISSAIARIREEHRQAVKKARRQSIQKLRKSGIKHLLPEDAHAITGASKIVGNLVGGLVGSAIGGGSIIGFLTGSLLGKVMTHVIDRLSSPNRKKAISAAHSLKKLQTFQHVWKLFDAMKIISRIMRNAGGAGFSGSNEPWTVVEPVAGLLTSGAKEKDGPVPNVIRGVPNEVVAEAIVKTFMELDKEISDGVIPPEELDMNSEKTVKQLFSDFMVTMFPALSSVISEKKDDNMGMCQGCGDVKATTEYAGKKVCADCKAEMQSKSEKNYMSVTKQADGKYRWLMVSTTAFGPDGDGEWVTEKALNDWVDRFNTNPVRANGEPVVLRWWHMGSPDPLTRSKGPGIDLGTADFAAMHSKSLVMSGLFEDAEVAEKFSDEAPSLGVSIGFFHPINEPVEKEFHAIDIYEVSPLPIWRSSNPLTSFGVVKKELSMLTDREKKLREMVGDEKVDSLLATIEQKEGAAVVAGLRNKEAPAPPVVTAPTEPPKDPESPDGEDAAFVEAITEALTGALAPVTESLGQLTSQMNGLQPLEATTKEMSVNLQALTERLIKVEQTVQAVESTAKEAKKGVNELMGDQPRNTARGGFRPSKDESTLTSQEAAEKDSPQPDSFGSFVNDFVLAK